MATNLTQKGTPRKRAPRAERHSLPPFAKWLNNQFITWQRANPRGTVTRWATSLGVNRNLLNQWLIGRHVPGYETCRTLARTLGTEVYIQAGHNPPDPLQDAVIANWGELDDNDLAAIKRIVERVASRRPSGASDGAVASHDGGRKARVGR